MSQNVPNNFTTADVEIIDQQLLHQGHVTLVNYQLRHRLFSGDWSKVLSREVLTKRHAIGVLLYDPHRDEVVLIEEFRIGPYSPNSNPWQLGVVAGLLEENESPEEVAQRETLEEANCIILNLVPITQYWVSPGISAEKITLFCGQIDASLAGGIYGIADEGEDIRVQVYSRKEAYNGVLNGQINNAISIIALQWLELNYKDLQQKWLTSD